MTSEQSQFFTFSMRCTKGALSVEKILAGKDDPVSKARLQKTVEFLEFLKGGYSISTGDINVTRLRAFNVLKACHGQLPVADVERASQISQALLAPKGRVGPGDVPHLYRVLDRLAESLFQACRPTGRCF